MGNLILGNPDPFDMPDHILHVEPVGNIKQASTHGSSYLCSSRELVLFSSLVCSLLNKEMQAIATSLLFLLFFGLHKHKPEAKHNSMTHPQLLLLPLILIFLSASSAPILAVPPSTPPEIAATHDPNPDNKTVYRVSKLLCWGCLGEALEFLYRHNMVRAAHWEFPQVWDAQLERYARWWAGQRRGDCRLQHSFPEGGFTLGENIFWGSGSSWTPSDAVAAWAGEEKYYSYAANSCRDGEMCGHYTQIVWRSTRRIGCARVVCDSGDVFMTCNYDPPGNYVGERPY